MNLVELTAFKDKRVQTYSGGMRPLPLDFAYVGAFAVVVTAICVVISWRYLNK